MELISIIADVAVIVIDIVLITVLIRRWHE